MTSSPSRISVLLPFYKVDDALDVAIKSVVNQCFKDWSLKLISNNANDRALEIAHRWQGLDSRIELIEEPEQGIAFALNAGLVLADTEYIARMDADDVCLPERLSLQLAYLDAHPEIDVVSSQTIYRSEIKGSEGYKLFVDWQNDIVSPTDHALMRFIESPLAHPTIMFRRRLIETYGGYSTAEVPEDYELWLRWMDHDVKFYKIPKPLLVWNDHAARLSRNHENYSREAFFQVKCTYLARWIKRNISRNKKIIVCGSSRIGRKRAAMLENMGVDIYGFTDIKKRPNRQLRFIKHTDIQDTEEYFLINFISRRGAGEFIRRHFSALGFAEGQDFILAG